MINRMPQPPLVLLIAHAAPHFIYFSFIDCLYDSVHIVWDHTIQERSIHGLKRRFFFFNVSLTVVGLILNTRAVSRIPRPCRAIATICRVTSGQNPFLSYATSNVCRSPSGL